jgi:hypothetical protein
MTSTLQSHETFRIHVTAAAPAAPLAILSIAGILGIEPQQAADRLASLPTVLADGVAPPVARRLSAVLSAFGMQVRLDPTLSTPVAHPGLEIALQPTAGLVPALVRRAARIVELEPEVVSAGMSRPGGLVLGGLGEDRIKALRDAVRRDPAFRILHSVESTATYDAWRRPGEAVPVSDLVRLGLGGDRVTGAVAVGMNAKTARHLGRRFGGQLLILNRDFQRYDLRFVEAPELDPTELESFLAGRLSRARRIGEPGLIDRDLSHRTMRQFRKDYAAIGIVVQAELRGLSRLGAQNR